VRQLLISLPDPNEKLFRRCSRLLYKICKARGILPASCIIQPEDIHVDEFERSGGFADVSKGEYQGCPTAIKQLRIRIRSKDEIDNVFKVGDRARLDHCNRLFSTQRLCREILIWKHLSHPNVLPLFGVSVSKNPQQFRIITEWMPNGDAVEYVKSNPEANRLRLVSPAIITFSSRVILIPLTGFRGDIWYNLPSRTWDCARRYQGGACNCILHGSASLTILIGQYPR